MVGLLLVFIITSSVNATNLIANGDFSDGLNDWLTFDSDGDVDFSIKDGWGDHKDYLAFSSGGVGQYGRLIQKFDIGTGVAGITVDFDYQISFGESGNGNAWDKSDDPSSYFKAMINLDLNDEGLYKYSNMEVILNTNETTRWTHVAMEIIFDGYVTDISPNARIKFQWNEQDDWMSNAKLDNISVTAVASVPEPATMLLFGLGLLGFTGVCRRK